MATQGPSLQVQASPVNTFVSAAAPAVALYDQQQVQMALQLVDAFSDLSVTAAQFAGSMKAEQNEEDIKTGIDLVNKSRKSYQKLVESGEIKPTENPWMAVGAQQASGTLEGMKARAEFERIYAQKAVNDPKFFDSPEAFDALAAQYVQNANVNLGDASYQTRSFYEAFNPYIASKAMQHEEGMAKFQENKILTGIQAKVFTAIQDSASQNESVRNDAITALQDLMSTPQGVAQQAVNRTVIETFVQAMSEGDNPQQAQRIFDSIKSGTGLLKDTAEAKAALGQAQAAIRRNINSLTHEESIAFDKWIGSDLIPTVLKGGLSDQQARDMLNGYFTGSNQRITVSAEAMEAKKGYALNRLEEARNEAERQLQKSVQTTMVETIETLSDESNMDVARQRFDETVEFLGLPTEDKWKWEAMFESQYNKNAERRSMRALQQREELLWNGVAGTGGAEEFGLKQQAATQFAAYFSKNELPTFQNFKGELDDFLIEVGVSPGTDKAKAVYRTAYSQFDSVLTEQINAIAQSQFQGNLMPVEGEPTDVRRAKADLRGKAAMLRLRMGITFDDTRAATDIVGRAMSAMNPAAAEAGTVETWPVEDLINAYNNAIQTTQPIDGILPGGPYGDALKDSLAYAANRTRAGDNPEDVVRDLVSQQFFGTTMKVEKDALSRSSLVAGHYVTGKGQDAEDYQTTFGLVLEQGSVTNPDTAPYAAAAFSQEFQKAIMKPPHNPRVAHEAAREAVMNNHIFVRGSMVPKHPSFGASVDENFLGTWLSLKYPNNPDATLVVATVDANGTPVMAVRDAQGNALVPVDAEDFAPVLYTPTDIVGDSANVVRALPDYMRVRGFREQVREPLTALARDAASNPGFSVFRIGEALRGAVQAAAQKPRKEEK